MTDPLFPMDYLPEMPDLTPNRPPLWEVMHDAYLKPNLSGPRGHLGFAAEIRAIADWLVPEEAPLTDEEAACLVTWGKWRQRTRQRDRLLAEADRAEAGAGE